jgi:hypothetical protein
MVDLALCPFSEQLGLTEADVFEVPEMAQFLVSASHDQTPNTVVEIAGGYAVWLTPTRLLAVTATPPGGFVSDASHGQAMFVIAAHADDLLAMGCTLPPASLAEGHCAQTLFAGLKALLYRRAGALHIHVERQLAPHLRDWLRQAATAL